MRSTRAVAAVERLKERSQNPNYAMIVASGRFYLALRTGEATNSPAAPGASANPPARPTQ